MKVDDATVAEVVSATTTPDITPATPPAPVQPSDDLALRLVEYAEDARQAYAGNTQRAIRSDTRIFGAWCGARGLEALPAAPETIARFVGWQMARGLTVATTRRRVASIAHMHRAAGLPDPTKTNKVRLRMKAMAREVGTAQRQARGLGEGEVNQIIGALGASPGFYELRGLSMLLVARDGLLRRSEVVALDLGDLDLVDDGSGRLLIRRSKADQEGAGAVVYLSPRTMTWLRRWIVTAEIEGGPLFVTRAGTRISHTREVARAFQRLADRAGLGPGYSGHSARVGMAIDLVGDGADLAAVMTAGRWATPAMVARYTRSTLAGRGAVARFYARRNGAGR